jgi:hypothetical protein
MILNQQIKKIPKWIFLWLVALLKYRSYIIIQQNESPARARLMELCYTHKFVTQWYFSYLISLVKLAEHNRIQLVWVSGHMGTDGPISRTRLLPFTYLQRLLGEWSGVGQAGNTRSTGSPFNDKSRLGLS